MVVVVVVLAVVEGRVGRGGGRWRDGQGQCGQGRQVD